jgi:signal transduction histidine kinase
MVATEGPAPSGVPRQEAWVRWIVGWHLAFWALIGLSLLQVLITRGAGGPRQRWAAGATVIVLALAYLVTVQPTWSQDPGGSSSATRRRLTAYLVVAVVATGVVCAIDPMLSMLLFIVYPQAWMLTSSRRAGVGFTVAISVSALTGLLAGAGFSLLALRDAGPSMLVSLLFSLLLGTWITRVIEQSRDRAELIAQVEATRSELAVAHHAQGVMAERERMAREIHDTLAQGFTSIVMLAQAAAVGLPRNPGRAAGQLALIEDVARENLAEARALVSAFTPVGLDSGTLVDAVRRLVERFGRETGLDVDLQVGPGIAGLSRAQEVVVLRATQEALTNVRRHAAARRVTVRLAADGQGTRVEVVDDGAGFRTGGAAGGSADGSKDGAVGGRTDRTTADRATADRAAADGLSGFGLVGIRSRVAEVGGRLDVASSPGCGTTVTVLLPRGDAGRAPAGPAGQPDAGPAGQPDAEPAGQPDADPVEEAR